MSSVTLAPRKTRPSRTDSESTHLPPLRFIPTMQPTLVGEPPSGPEWLHEVKYDGYRTQLHVAPKGVKAYSRNGHDWTSKFPTIVNEARSIPAAQAILDGEVCVQDERGVTDFGALPNAIRHRPQDLIFFAFDLLHLDGVDLRQQTLEERRAKLRLLISQVPGSRIVLSDEFDGDGKVFFKAVEKHGLEGIVSKRKGSRYISGNVQTWQKTKCWATTKLQVIGVERDKVGIPYALLADATGYQGTAFIALPGARRTQFWRYVEDQTVQATTSGSRKKAILIRPGMSATVRYLKGSRLRHAVVQKIEIESGLEAKAP